jgi:predicted nucleic acid-binding protein
VNKQQRTAVDGFLEPFQQAGRMVTPDSGVFIEAGRVLALMNREGIGTSHLPQITNDVLIAVSATRAGAAVVTLNIRDFTRIERLTPVRWIAPGPWDQAGRRLTTKP